MPRYYKPEKLNTKDGSDTLIHSEWGELYHSRHGAITESRHVFIQHGLMNFIKQHPQKANINILEMGLGSGLNTILSQEVAEKHKINITYTGIEMFPVDFSIVEKMKFEGLSNDSVQLLYDLHRKKWNKNEKVSPYFCLNKIQGSFLDHDQFELYDIIYYDAFAPNAQPELWDENAIGLCYRLLSTPGYWVSYCAKGSVKRTLKKAGFNVIPLPGPPFKREMTRGEKI